MPTPQKLGVSAGADKIDGVEGLMQPLSEGILQLFIDSSQGGVPLGEAACNRVSQSDEQSHRLRRVAHSVALHLSFGRLKNATLKAEGAFLRRLAVILSLDNDIMRLERRGYFEADGTPCPASDDVRPIGVSRVMSAVVERRAEAARNRTHEPLPGAVLDDAVGRFGAGVLHGGTQPIALAATYLKTMSQS